MSRDQASYPGSARPDEDPPRGEDLLFQYPVQRVVSEGVRTYTDAMSQLIKETLSGSAPDDWWDSLVLGKLDPDEVTSIRDEMEMYQGSDHMDYVDASHFLNIVVRNYDLFGLVFGLGQGNQDHVSDRLRTAANASNRLSGRSNSGDVPQRAAQEGLIAMGALADEFDKSAARSIDRNLDEVKSVLAPSQTQQESQSRQEPTPTQTPQGREAEDTAPRPPTHPTTDDRVTRAAGAPKPPPADGQQPASSEPAGIGPLTAPLRQEAGWTARILVGLHIEQAAGVAIPLGVAVGSFALGALANVDPGVSLLLGVVLGITLGGILSDRIAVRRFAGLCLTAVRRFCVGGMKRLAAGLRRFCVGGVSRFAAGVKRLAAGVRRFCAARRETVLRSEARDGSQRE